MLHYPTIRHLRAFEAVARLGSFGNAADLLCISPSAISQNITQFEEILEVRLIDRTTRHMELTEIGHQLYPRILRWLEEMEETFLETIQNGRLSKGHVRVGSLASFAINVLPSVIDSFNLAHPNIRISIQDDTGVGVEKALAAGLVDLGIVGEPPRESELEFTRLFEEPYCLLCPSGHPLAKQKKKTTWSQLKSHDYIALSRQTNIGQHLNSLSEVSSKIPDPVHEVAQLATIWGLVDNGYGVSALPASACPRNSQVETVALHNPQIFRKVGVLTHRQRSLSPAAEQFFLLLKSSFPVSQTKTSLSKTK